MFSPNTHHTHHITLTFIKDKNVVAKIGIVGKRQKVRILGPNNLENKQIESNFGAKIAIYKIVSAYALTKIWE